MWAKRKRETPKAKRETDNNKTLGKGERRCLPLLKRLTERRERKRVREMSAWGKQSKEKQKRLAQNQMHR